MIDSKTKIMGTGKRPVVHEDDTARLIEGGGKKTNSTNYSATETAALVELVKVLAREHVRATLDRQREVPNPQPAQVPRRA
jgi:hypothetical protein